MEGPEEEDQGYPDGDVEAVSEDDIFLDCSVAGEVVFDDGAWWLDGG